MTRRARWGGGGPAWYLLLTPLQVATTATGGAVARAAWDGDTGWVLASNETTGAVHECSDWGERRHVCLFMVRFRRE